ncbi:hypothetical protein AB6A40_010783 [Gnathostoma spinigerum]|uniref:Craniofacial development protein 2-like n=1 Tax=Gnathostoma spinigerum TaxID=75299 RepID=A0ABD6EVU6_9BILA
MRKIKIDIVGICETRRHADLTAQWWNGDQVYLRKAQGNQARTGGVGFIIRKRAVPFFVSFDTVSLRTAGLVLRVDKKRTLKTVQGYSATQQADDEEVEQFYEEIERMMQRRTTYTTVQGDFNATVGKQHDKELLLRKFGNGTRNERGPRLLSFAESRRLHVMNTLFQKSEKHQWT